MVIRGLAVLLHYVELWKEDRVVIGIIETY